MSLLLLLLCALAQQMNAERFLLYRATPLTDHALQALHKMQLLDHKYKVDFWKNSLRVGDAADVMIAEKHSRLLEQRFKANNIDFSIALQDVERLIRRNEGNSSISSFGRRLHDDPILDSEPDRDHSKVGKLRRARYPFGDYASYSDMMKYMRTIEFYYPNFTRIIRLGTTHEGKPIEGLKIAYPINATRRGVWIDGNIHAREWASSHTGLFIINQLVSGYGKDETLTHYVNNLNFYIVPCLNADGYEFTRSSPVPSVRLWRKNRSPEICRRSSWGGEKCCRGVDLNRNFDFHWAESGSSFEPCSNIYHGDSVFSEPEAKAVRDFHKTPEIKGNIDAFITLHSYAQLWIYPFSHAERMYPEDINDLKKTARKAITRLRRSYGTEYRMGTGADTLGPASGGSDDWAKSKLGAKYVYLVELRPQMQLSNGFILHKNELIPTAIETFEAVQEVIEAVLQQNNIKVDPLTRIPIQLRRKQLYRMKLMELEKKNPTTRSSTSTSTTSTTTIIPSSASTTETTQHESTGTTRSTTITTETIVSESTSRTTSWGRRTWLRNRNEETLRKLRRKIFKSATFESPTIPSEVLSSTTAQTAESLVDNNIELESTTFAASGLLETTTMSAPLNTTTFIFFTNTKPASFKDPNCRDMRYSCAFWLRHNENVCLEQESFMRAQCAFTCKFCTTTTEEKRSR